MDDYFTIDQYITEEPRNIEISALVSLGFVLVWNKHVFLRSKMAVFQTYNKKYEIRNVAIWTEKLQVQRYITNHGNHLAISENKHENYQIIEKHWENKCTFLFSFTQALLLVLVPEYDGVSRKHKTNNTFYYLNLTHHLLILSMFKFLTFWVLDT